MRIGIFLVAAVFSGSVYAQESLEQSWPACKGWSFGEDPYRTYTPEKLNRKQALHAMQELAKHSGQEWQKYDHENVLAMDLQLLEGYVLLTRMESATTSKEKATTAFCAWVQKARMDA